MTAEDARDVIARSIGDMPDDDIEGPTLDEYADAVVAALKAAGWELRKKPDPLLDVRDEDGNYLGKQGSIHEHRTVGDYRAWSYDAHEWCYPKDPCHLCKEMTDAGQAAGPWQDASSPTV